MVRGQPEDDGCGVGELCFEEEAPRLGHWRYQGAGQGAYEKVEDLKFVGQGKGSWDREVLQSPARCRFSGLCCCFILLMGTAVGLGYAILARTAFQSRDDVVLTFDCMVGIESWDSAWTDEKKAYCCTRVGHGCPAQPFDCHAARDNWQAAWSEAKKTFCCDFEKGCPDGAPTFECTGSEGSWSAAKKGFCCKTHNRGCSEPYDCRAGVTNWQSGWSDHKKYWCCQKYDVACPNPVVYDCDEGYSTWRSTWAAEKKAWCCGRLHRGCEDEAPAPVTQVVEKVVQVPVVVHHVHHVHHSTWTTDSGYQCWRDAGWRSWSAEHRHFCCRKHHVACGDPHAHHIHHVHVTHVVYEHGSSDGYDCAAGVRNWRAGWSDSKKSFCCQKYELGCEAATGIEQTGQTVVSSVSGASSMVDGVVSSGTVVDAGDATSAGVVEDGGVVDGDATTGGVVEDGGVVEGDATTGGVVEDGGVVEGDATTGGVVEDGGVVEGDATTGGVVEDGGVVEEGGATSEGVVEDEGVGVVEGGATSEDGGVVEGSLEDASEDVEGEGMTIAD